MSTERPGAIDLSIGLLPSRAVAQTRDDVKIRPSPFPKAAGLERRVNIGVRGSGRARRQDTHDGVGFTSEQNSLAKDARVGEKKIAPLVVTKNNHLRPVWTVLLFGVTSPDEWLDRQHVEVVRRDASVTHVLDARAGLQVKAR